jgi:hypothetical protein
VMTIMLLYTRAAYVMPSTSFDAISAFASAEGRAIDDVCLLYFWGGLLDLGLSFICRSVRLVSCTVDGRMAPGH